MKGRFFLALAIAVTLAMTGCTETQKQYTLDAGVTVSQAQALKLKYIALRDTIENKQEADRIFSEDEWASLQEVAELINALVDEYFGMASLKTTAISPGDVRIIWSSARSAYSRAREIVLVHLDEFTASEQVKLVSFDQRAEDLDDRIAGLLDNESYDNINQAVSMIASVIRLSLGVAGMVASK